ncbi:serine/threonine-protein kinase STY17 [Capsella rubella]|uniref:serine/threonine-protein kinase STY17 n=1 Tax=Capsella rubella TaxID=81985 RepID=UPI000CD5C0B9|nr:serine/threonine-protein kinase STY17 [Capsella rubella]
MSYSVAIVIGSQGLACSFTHHHIHTSSSFTQSSLRVLSHSLAQMAFSNNPSGNESNEQFRFRINSELLLDPNDLLVGSMIGVGDYFTVYQGWFRNQFPVAVKIVQPRKASAVSIEEKKLFQREVVLLSKMKHDNIVEFFGASIEPQLMIVTELIEGGTLQKYMLNCRPSPPDVRMSLGFALDISRAMEFLHSKGIIHRDLNPRNLLVTGDQEHVKLADFGIARRETRGVKKTFDSWTCRWMAPEVISNEPLRIGEKRHYDHKVDVYSFAVVFWELLSNQPPFPKVPSLCVSSLVNRDERPCLGKIPYQIIPILESCWDKDPDARPEFREITDSLTNLLSNLTPDTYADDEAYDADIEDSENSPQHREVDEAKEEEDKKKKKKVVKKMIRPFVKMFRACFYKP